MAEVLVEQIKRLKAREAKRYKQKLGRAVRRLIDIYNIEDWQELGLAGTDDESIYRWAYEYCHGLTITECLERLEQEISMHGFKETLNRNIKAIEDEINRLESKAKFFHNIARVFQIPVDVDEYTAEELYRLYENPEQDGEMVESIVKHYMMELGYPEQEAEQIAKRSRQALEKIMESRNRHIVVAHWTQILQAIHKRGIKAYETRNKLAKQLIARLRQQQSEQLILSIREVTELIGGRIERPRHSKTVREAIERLKKAGAKEAVVGIRPGEDVIIFSFIDENPTCELIKDKSTGAWIISKCTSPILLVKQKEGSIYFYAVEKRIRGRKR